MRPTNDPEGAFERPAESPPASVRRVDIDSAATAGRSNGASLDTDAAGEGPDIDTAEFLLRLAGGLATRTI